MEVWVIKETGAKTWFITSTVVFWIGLALGLKGQQVQTYVLSFVFGCLPLCVLAYVRPFFNPYSNFLTQRDQVELTDEERASLKVLKTPQGKRAVLKTIESVAIVLFSLYLVRNNSLLEQIPVGRHLDWLSGTILGSAGTFALTLSYLPFFWSRVLWKHIQKTLQLMVWWVLTPLLAALLAWPAAARAYPGPAGSDPFEGRHNRMACFADSVSHNPVFLHLTIRWQLITWMTNADALGRITTFEYDAAGNVTKIIDPALHETRFEYEPTFNRVKKITDALNQITEFTYDPANGNLLTTKDPLNHVTTITYNAFGQPLTVKDPLNHTTTFTYDTNGNLLTTTDPLNNQTVPSACPVGELGSTRR